MLETAGKTKILVVDDEPLIVEIIAEALKGHGYDVSIAHDGQAAKALLDQNSHFDIVISDLRMPKMDGVTLLRHWKTHSPKTKFIAMTGFAETNGDRLIELGADEFVSKPFVMDKFNDIITRLQTATPQLDKADEGFEVI